jgi:hypothetical protein
LRELLISRVAADRRASNIFPTILCTAAIYTLLLPHPPRQTQSFSACTFQHRVVQTLGDAKQTHYHAVLVQYRKLADAVVHHHLQRVQRRVLVGGLRIYKPHGELRLPQYIHHHLQKLATCKMLQLPDTVGRSVVAEPDGFDHSHTAPSRLWTPCCSKITLNSAEEVSSALAAPWSAPASRPPRPAQSRPRRSPAKTCWCRP